MSDFVSRGGIKLQAALDQFQIDVKDKIVLDVGSSTGGFVDCLLQNKAAKVYALDTAYGELAWKLRNDPRVIVMERTNILYLESLPITDTLGVGFDSPKVNKVDFVTIDAGWTKLGLILPVVKKFLKPEGEIVVLLKPHYEASKKDLAKGVLPAEIAEQVKDQVMKAISNLKFQILNRMESPILGGAGNREYLLLLKL